MVRPETSGWSWPRLIVMGCIFVGVIANLWPFHRAAGVSEWNVIRSAETRYGWPLTCYVEFERGYITDAALWWDDMAVPQYTWPLHGVANGVVVVTAAALGYIIPTRWRREDIRRKRNTIAWRARTSTATARPS